jgi:two-component system LytT family response regulator
MKIKCAIIDDEPLAIELLKNYTDNVPFLELVFKSKNPLDIIPFLETNTIDVLFLDIQMPQISGIQLSRIITNKTRIIFTTAYKEFALEGYEFNTVDYLLKPITFDQFYKAARKVKALVDTSIPRNEELQLPIEENLYFFVKTDSRWIKIYFNEIKYIEGLKDYVMLHTQKEKIIILENLKELAVNLEDKGFMRVHKSFIANLNKITSIERNRIFIEKEIIPIGETFRDTFFKWFEKKK